MYVHTYIKSERTYSLFLKLAESPGTGLFTERLSRSDGWHTAAERVKEEKELHSPGNPFHCLI